MFDCLFVGFVLFVGILLLFDCVGFAFASCWLSCVCWFLVVVYLFLFTLIV